MNYAYIVEIYDDEINEWVPTIIMLTTSDEMQMLMDKFADQSETAIHSVRWRRITSPEKADEYHEAGCEIRARDFNKPIDWS